MKSRKLFLAAIASVVVVFASACSETPQEEETSASEESSSSEQTMAASPTEEETSTMTAETTEEMVGAGEVTVGGFTVESPGVPESEIPEVETSREDVNEYLGLIRPVIDDTVRDISSLVNPEVQVGEDGVSLDVNVSSLEEARQSVADGAAELREIQPPEGLEPINERLIEAYEDARPAYQGIAEAAESGDPEQFATATQENLPQIQSFNAEVNAIIEDLERAGGSVE